MTSRVLLLFIFTMGIYIISSPPTLTVGGDSGEFITSTYTLGVSHPPGFPLYCLVGKIFSLIPVSNHGWRINLLSMFFSSLTVVVVFVSIVKIIKNEIIALICSLSYAFSVTAWSQSTIAEVYSLNAFFVIFCFLILLIWEERKKMKYFYLFSFVLGISLGNHYPLMFLASCAYGLFIYKHKMQYLNVKQAFVAFCFLLLGLTVYLYLPIRAASNPPINWGNPRTAKSFFNHLIRQQYRITELEQRIDLQDKINFVKNYFIELVKQFRTLVIFIVLGIWSSFRWYRKFSEVILILFLTNSIGLIFLLHFHFTPEKVSIVNVYYLPSYIAATIWLSCGLDYIVKSLDKEKTSYQGQFARSLFLTLILVVGCYNSLLSLQINNQRNNFLAYDYGRNILSFVEKGGILFVQKAGDETLFPLLFLNKVMRIREDLKIFDCWGNVFENIYGDDFTLLTDENKWLERRKKIENQLIYSTTSPVYYVTVSQEGGVTEHQLRWLGLVYKVIRNKENNQTKPDNIWYRCNFRGIDKKKFNEFQERAIVGRYYLFMGQDLLDQDSKREKEGFLCLEKAYQSSKDVDWIVNNIGLVYYRNGSYESARRKFLSLLHLYPTHSVGWYNLGLTYRQEGLLTDAQICFEKSIQYNPSDLDSYKELADVYWEEGLTDKATKIWQTVLKNNLKYAELYFLLGYNFYKEKKFQKALEEWEKALLIKPDYALIYYNCGVVCVELKLYNKAKEMFSAFLALEPNNNLSRRVKQVLKEIN